MTLKQSALLAVLSLGFTTGMDGNCAKDFDTVLCDANVDAPDPAVTDIQFLLVDKYTATTGRIQVWAVVENKGLGRYESDPGLQSIQLFEDGVLVKDYPFEDLAPGDSIGAVYYREWTDATREFPPTYRAVLVYDPDILLDGNPMNNDCSLSDNLREESGAEANEVFK